MHIYYHFNPTKIPEMLKYQDFDPTKTPTFYNFIFLTCNVNFGSPYYLKMLAPLFSSFCSTKLALLVRNLNSCQMREINYTVPTTWLPLHSYSHLTELRSNRKDTALACMKEKLRAKTKNLKKKKNSN